MLTRPAAWECETLGKTDFVAVVDWIQCAMPCSRQGDIAARLFIHQNICTRIFIHQNIYTRIFKHQNIYTRIFIHQNILTRINIYTRAFGEEISFWLEFILYTLKFKCWIISKLYFHSQTFLQQNICTPENLTLILMQDQNISFPKLVTCAKHQIIHPHLNVYGCFEFYTWKRHIAFTLNRQYGIKASICQKFWCSVFYKFSSPPTLSCSVFSGFHDDSSIPTLADAKLLLSYLACQIHLLTLCFNIIIIAILTVIFITILTVIFIFIAVVMIIVLAE